MRKYWKSTLLFIFIAIVVGVFYIQTSTVSNGFAQFKFEKIEGNEAAIEDLIINGDLFNGMFNFEPFQVDSEGTTYIRDEAYTKRMRGYYQDLYFERLQKEYRNFMRGKAEDQDLYYEDENILAYGDTPHDLWSFDNYMFKIAVLDKQTNDTVSFSLPIPNRGDFWYVTPYGVYVDGKELSIITQNEKMSDSMVESVSVHVYTFDIDKKELLKEEVVGSLDQSSSEKGYSDVSIIKDGATFVIAGSEITRMDDEDESGYYEEVSEVKKLIKYNIKTKEVEEIPVPENVELGIPYALSGDQLHFANVKLKQLTLTTYHIEKQKVSKELEVEDINTSVGDIFQVKVEDGKLYLVSSYHELEKLTSILVVDLDTLTIDYFGKVEYVHPPKDNETVEIYFNFPELKK